MDLRFLQSFVAVVELGSIAEAARRLDLTPATVAQRMRALEADVGTRLIARAGRTVRPTAAGSRVLDRARAVLREVRDLKSAASATDLPAGPLRLGATPTALMGLVPTYLKRWLVTHPAVEIYIEPGTSARLVERVMAGELDAAIVVHPNFELPKTCAWHLLRQERLVLLTPVDMLVSDPLLTAAAEPFIRYDRGVVAGRMADAYLRERGVRPRVRFELDGIEHIAMLVGEGLGVSVVPDWPVIGEPSSMLRRWRLPEPCPLRSVGFVWMRSAVRSPLAKAFVEVAVGRH